MNKIISVTNLKKNPNPYLSLADDCPVAVQKRNKVRACLIGNGLYEKTISYIEEANDRRVIEKTDFDEDRDFEELAMELGI